MYFGNIFRIMCNSKICGKICKKFEFLSFTEVCANQKFKSNETLRTAFRVRHLVRNNLLSFIVFEERW